MKFHLLVLIYLTKVGPAPLQLHCILTGTTGADAFHDHVPFLKPKLLWMENLRYTGIGKIEGFRPEVHLLQQGVQVFYGGKFRVNQ